MATSRDWLERFQTMVDELREHPRVAITHLWIGEPVADTEIARVEAAVGFELDEHITGFYRQANGLQFRWMDRLSECFVAGRDDVTQTERGRYICGDDDDAMGVIDIFPLGEALVDTDYEDIIWSDWMEGEVETFGGRDYDLLEWSKAVRPFDQFSFYNSAAFFVGDGQPGSTVIMGDDHNATFLDSRITDLTSYLEFVLAHRGMPDPRRETFVGWSASSKPPLVFTASDFADLPKSVDEVLPDRGYLPNEADFEDDMPMRVMVKTGLHGHGTRATVLGRVQAPAPPKHWSYPTDLLRVAFDLGPVGYVVERSVSVIRYQDQYEHARADADAFFDAVTRGSRAERVEKMGYIGPGADSSMQYLINTDTETFELLVDAHVHRYLALLTQMTTAEALDRVMSLVEAIIDDGLDVDFTVTDSADEAYSAEEFGDRGIRGSNAGMVAMLSGVLAMLLIERYNDAPYDNIRDEFGDAFALRLAQLVGGLTARSHRGRPFPNLEFFSAAIEDFPGGCKLHVRNLGSGYTSEQFGLDEAGLPVLSG